MFLLFITGSVSSHEHHNCDNSDISYITSNYSPKCTPQEELEAVLCPRSGKRYPGAGTSKGEREILPFRVFLSVAGCLDDDQRQRFEPVLKELVILCGPLELDEEDKVNEALRLLRFAVSRSSSMIRQ